MIDRGRMRTIDRRSVEQIYRRALTGSQDGAASIVNKGVRAALARDPYLMQALEECAKIMAQIAEEQQGQMRRSTSTKIGARVEATESAIFRKAYEHADRGDHKNALITYGWIYGAVGEYVGIFTS